MPHSISIYTDENVSRAVIRGLRQRGVDVLSAPEAGMLEKSDEEHLELAKELGRVLLTHDVDFFALSGRVVDHSGIIFAKQQIRIGRIILGVIQVWESLDAPDMKNRIEVL